MINKECCCYNKIEAHESSKNSVGFCVYNNSLDFDCSKCKATKSDKADAIYMADKMEETIRRYRKRR